MLKAGLAFLASVPASVDVGAAQAAAARARGSRAASTWRPEGVELVPQAINRLGGTISLQGHVPFLEDYAPEGDVKYTRLCFTDILGAGIFNARRGRDAGLGSSASSRRSLGAGSASSKALTASASTRRLNADLPASPDSRALTQQTSATKLPTTPSPASLKVQTSATRLPASSPARIAPSP